MIRRLIAIYMSVFILALLVGINLMGEAETEGISWIEVFAYILISTVVMLILIKFFGAGWIIKLVEIAAIGLSVYVLFASLGYKIGVAGYGIALGFALLAVVLRLLSMFRNELAALSAAGVAGLIGISLAPIQSLLLLIALAIYDYIAVFKTHHMQTLAKAVRKEEAAFSIKEVRKVKVGEKVKEEFMEIGTGDLLMPALVATSFLNADISYSLGVIAGTLLGFKFLIYALRHYKKLLPAIPFLTIGIILGLLFVFVLRVVMRVMIA